MPSAPYTSSILILTCLISAASQIDAFITAPTPIVNRPRRYGGTERQVTPCVSTVISGSTSRSVGLYSSASSDDVESNSGHESPRNQLDAVLSRLTSAFPFFVLGSALLATRAPKTLLWVNQGNLISIMLATVMAGTGMTLEKKDFTDVLKQYPASVPAGVLCQFLIMPLSAFVVGRTFLLKAGLDAASSTAGPALFLGLTLVGCSPGGTASNLVSLIAGADVALSVLLTSCSTILASAVTPLLVKTLVGRAVEVSGMALCAATAKVVLAPVLLGMILNERAPTLTKALSRFTPFASVVLVALICGGVVAQNASAILGLGGTASLMPVVVASVLLLHSLGFLVGYSVPRFGLRYKEKTARTISIETGMQNSALAVVLARSIGADPLASLPGALSATAHSCLGSILAAWWRYTDAKKNQ